MKHEVSLTDKNGKRVSKSKFFQAINPGKSKENGDSVENFYKVPSGNYLLINEKKGKETAKIVVLHVDDNGNRHPKQVVTVPCSLLDYF